MVIAIVVPSTGFTGNSNDNRTIPAQGKLKRYNQDGCNNEIHGDHGDTSLSYTQPGTIKNPSFNEKAGRMRLLGVSHFDGPSARSG
jgi:hypothetical protein